MESTSTSPSNVKVGVKVIVEDKVKQRARSTMGPPRLVRPATRSGAVDVEVIVDLDRPGSSRVRPSGISQFNHLIQVVMVPIPGRFSGLSQY